MKYDICKECLFCCVFVMCINCTNQTPTILHNNNLSIDDTDMAIFNWMNDEIGVMPLGSSNLTDTFVPEADFDFLGLFDNLHQQNNTETYSSCNTILENNTIDSKIKNDCRNTNNETIFSCQLEYQKNIKTHEHNTSEISVGKNECINSSNNIEKHGIGLKQNLNSTESLYSADIETLLDEGLFDNNKSQTLEYTADNDTKIDIDKLITDSNTVSYQMHDQDLDSILFQLDTHTNNTDKLVQENKNSIVYNLDDGYIDKVNEADTNFESLVKDIPHSATCQKISTADCAMDACESENKNKSHTINTDNETDVIKDFDKIMLCLNTSGHNNAAESILLNIMTETNQQISDQSDSIKKELNEFLLFRAGSQKATQNRKRKLLPKSTGINYTTVKENNTNESSRNPESFNFMSQKKHTLKRNKSTSNDDKMTIKVSVKPQKQNIATFHPKRKSLKNLITVPKKNNTGKKIKIKTSQASSIYFENTMNSIIQQQLYEMLSKEAVLKLDPPIPVILKNLYLNVRVIFVFDLLIHKNYMHLIRYSLSETIKQIPKFRKISDVILKANETNSFYITGPSKNLYIPKIKVYVYVENVEYMLVTHKSYKCISNYKSLTLFDNIIKFDEIQNSLQSYEFFVYHYINPKYIDYLETKGRLQLEKLYPLVFASSYENINEVCEKTKMLYSERKKRSFLKLFQGLELINLTYYNSIESLHKIYFDLEFIVHHNALQLYFYLYPIKQKMVNKPGDRFSIIEYIKCYFGRFHADGSFQINSRIAMLRIVYLEIEYLFEYINTYINNIFVLSRKNCKLANELINTTLTLFCTLEETLRSLAHLNIIKEMFLAENLFIDLYEHKLALTNLLLEFHPNNIIITTYRCMIKKSGEIPGTLHCIINDENLSILWLFKLDCAKLWIYKPLGMLRDTTFVHNYGKSYFYNDCIRAYCKELMTTDEEFRFQVMQKFIIKLLALNLLEDQISFFMGIYYVDNFGNVALYKYSDICNEKLFILKFDKYFQYLYIKTLIFELYSIFKDCQIYKVYTSK